MKRLIALFFAIGASCSLVDNTSDIRIHRSIPAMIYLQPSPFMYGKDQAVILSSPTNDVGVIHLEPEYRRVRYRQIVNATVRFDQGRVFVESIRDTLIRYNEVRKEIRQVTIDRIRYPYIWLDGKRYSYEAFLLDYKSLPPYEPGHKIFVVTDDEDLLAIM